MATDINKYAITGRMTQDARLEYTHGGMAICNGSIAVNRTTTVKSTGEKKEEVSYFDFKILGNFAERMAQYLTKGQELGIEGYLKQERWEAQDGSKRSRVVLNVEGLKLLGGRGSRDQEAGSNDQYGNAGEAFNGGYGYGA